MGKRLLFSGIVVRYGWTIQCFALSLVFLCTSTTLALSSQEFNSSHWKHFREIHIPAEVKEGLVGVALESELLEKCRPDLADIRVVSPASQLVPTLLTDAPDGEDAPPFPAQVFRVTKRPGKFTEIWIDKKAKVLTRSVIIQTSSKDFTRKVEVRGSDNARETYVIRVDGLIADLVKPEPFQSLDIEFPRPNIFQYLQLRILDDDQQPLKIDNVLCGPANAGLNLTKSLDARITDKRVTTSDNSAMVAIDLGQKRFPVTSIRISTRAKEFIRKVRITGKSSENESTYQELYNGTFFRIRKEDAVKEKLEARFKPQPYRYIEFELLGSGPPVNVDEIKATAAVRMAVFEHRKNLTYRIYYNNAQAKLPEPGPAPSAMNLGQIATLSSEIGLGPELNVPVTPVAKQAPPTEEPTAAKPSMLRRIAGITLLLAGLLILFAVMLRTRGLRRSGGRRDSHMLGKGDQFKISLREH